MGALYMGSDLAQIELGLPTAVTGLFQGILLFSLLACDFLIHYQIKVRRKRPVATTTTSAITPTFALSNETASPQSSHQKNDNGAA